MKAGFRSGPPSAGPGRGGARRPPSGSTSTGSACRRWELSPGGPGSRWTRLFLSLRPGAIDSPAAVSFLRNLRRHLRGPVVVLWDGRPAHRSRLVQAYLRTQAHGLTRERFPAYAPELNPVEGLWADLKSHASANYAADTIDELDQHLQGATRRLRRRDGRGLGYLKHTGWVGEQEYRQLCEDQ